ncbi:MAG: aspartate aminotransferase family protein [Elusimicrobiota bacterium]
MSSLLPVYNQLDIEVDKAEGKYVWDTEGKKYTDFFSGISVTNLGHRPPEVVEAINNITDSYLHISNLFPEKLQIEFADLLTDRIFPDGSGKIFFSNSGAEANECGLKIARKYFNGDKFITITFKNSFHGRTLATLAATGQKKFREGFGPMPRGYKHVDFNFLASVEDKIDSDTCAIMVEPIQGEGGVIPAKEKFMTGLREICDKKRILLIADEIQTGLGRTGQFLGCQNYGIIPDIVTLGKALGGGLPLAATAVTDEVAECMEYGDHGSTFGGNPVACAAGLATVKNIDEQMLSRVREKGDYFKEKLLELSRKYRVVREVRGKGLMLGMELGDAGKELISYLLDKGYIANCTQKKIIRFLPPFTIDREDIDNITGCIEEYFDIKKEEKL